MNTAIATIGSNSQIAAYAPFRARIGELKKLNAEKVFNYEDPKENKEARSHVYKLRQERAAVEETRKREKAESLEYGKRVDEQAKEIVAEITALIDVHAKPLDAIEQREKERLEAIKSRLNQIRELASKGDPFGGSYSSAVLKQNLVTLHAIPLDEATFGESLPDAVKAKEDSAIILERHIADAEKAEAAAAEMERLRKAEEERKQLEREERIRQEAAERATREAEERATAARAQAEREARAAQEAAERRERELQATADKAEREKRAAEERSARIAKETEERLKREAKERAEREERETAKREANKKHRAKINTAAADAFAGVGFTADQSKQIVALIAQGNVPNVSISY